MAYIGGKITWSVHFTNDAGADADPTTVEFYLLEAIDGTELRWIYNAVPVAGTHYPVGMNPIEKDSTGDYSLDYIARKAERHSGYWKGSGTVYQATPSTVFVNHAPVTSVEV